LTFRIATQRSPPDGEQSNNGIAAVARGMGADRSPPTPLDSEFVMACMATAIPQRKCLVCRFNHGGGGSGGLGGHCVSREGQWRNKPAKIIIITIIRIIVIMTLIVAITTNPVTICKHNNDDNY
jgi:hypothetical protein